MSSMKKIYVLIFIIAFIAGIVGFSDVVSAKKIVIKSTYPGSNRGFGPEMLTWWGSEVEKRSGGKIRVDEYYGGLLGTSKEMLYAVERGVCDVGILFPMYFEKELPLATTNTCTVATFKQDPVITSKAWWKLAKEFPEIPAEWEAYNQKLLMGWEAGPYIWTTKKPVNTIEDLKGMKIGVWGGKGARQLFKELGIIPISMPVTQIYDALDKGTMDGRACSTAIVKTYKLYEVAKYITDVGIGTIGPPVLQMSINLDTWKSIPPDLQKIILDVSKDQWGFFEKRARELLHQDREFLKKKGVKFLEFSDKDKAKIRSLPVFDTYKNKYLERGKAKGYSTDLFKKVYVRYKELIEEMEIEEMKK